MSAPIQFYDATLERFAREVAKYPADQKQLAVMACLAIVQQELGYVSAPTCLASCAMGRMRWSTCAVVSGSRRGAPRLMG